MHKCIFYCKRLFFFDPFLSSLTRIHISIFSINSKAKASEFLWNLENMPLWTSCNDVTCSNTLHCVTRRIHRRLWLTKCDHKVSLWLDYIRCVRLCLCLRLWRCSPAIHIAWIPNRSYEVWTYDGTTRSF